MKQKQRILDDMPVEEIESNMPAEKNQNSDCESNIQNEKMFYY